MFYKGDGVPQDYAETVRWLRRAAEQGEARAQFNLGHMFHNGEGVAQDYAEAVRWFRRAAGQGHAMAQFNLGVMFASGYGVPQDYVLAHMWFNLAASRVPPTETGKRSAAREARDSAARFLTPEALARAQRLAQEWRAGSDAEPPP